MYFWKTRWTQISNGIYTVKIFSHKPNYMSTVDWCPKINCCVHSQVQMCDAETSGTDVADFEANTVDQEV